MKKLIIALMLFATPMLSMGAASPVPLDDADVDLSDRESLQRGFKYFVNYCLSCHSAKYQRFERTANDLGLTFEDVKQNLMFTADKIGSTMDIAMTDEDANVFFGVTPPDLSLTTRSRGPDWVYTYMRSFYLDDSKPMGINNTVFPDVGMPHALWELQGWQEARFKKSENGRMKFEKFELVKAGSMTPEEYDAAMRDLVNFMTYLGDPSQMERKALGVKVILFLLVLFVLSYLLKKEYWKDIH
ncbi:MAG: cytochrome c1 [Candidatus Polarisedimenticolaceae bacterium]|nr:cytochrome c1 [Candidatus Polarisedimenticolaceae bacterium]